MQPVGLCLQSKAHHLHLSLHEIVNFTDYF